MCVPPFLARLCDITGGVVTACAFHVCIRVCVCVCACVSACACVRVRLCVCASMRASAPSSHMSSAFAIRSVAVVAAAAAAALAAGPGRPRRCKGEDIDRTGGGAGGAAVRPWGGSGRRRPWGGSGRRPLFINKEFINKASVCVCVCVCARGFVGRRTAETFARACPAKGGDGCARHRGDGGYAGGRTREGA